MSANAGRQFVDTNVLVYAHDLSAGDKHRHARRLLLDLWANGHGCLSVQVLQEFYVNITRKVRQPLTPAMARQQVEDLSQWLIHSLTAKDVVEAIGLHQRATIPQRQLELRTTLPECPFSPDGQRVGDVQKFQSKPSCRTQAAAGKG